MYNGGEDIGALVLDAGSNSFKFGYAGDDAPQAIFPAVVGKLDTTVMATSSSATAVSVSGGMVAAATTAPPPSFPSSSSTPTSYYVGSRELRVPRRHVAIDSPFSWGLMEKWDEVEALLSFAYSSTGNDPASRPLVMTDHPANDLRHRQQLCEILFEKFKVPGLLLSNSAVLSCFATGRQTGCVLQSGGQTTTVVPVCDGYAIPSHCVTSPLAGDLVTAQMLSMLEQRHSISLRPHHFFKKMIVRVEGSPFAMNHIKRMARPGGREGDGDGEATPGTKAVTFSMEGHQVQTIPLERKGYTPSFTRWHQLEIARRVKEELGRISDMPFSEEAFINVQRAPYELPGT